MVRTGPRALATAALLLLALTGCGASTEDPETRSAAALPVVPAEAGHVHGMALNPADGLLYLGTHGGTMVVQDDTIERVGDSTIDLMGFAAAGPDHFYASGHPGPGDDLPNPVGLIESTDGGETWQPLSLAGEVDFHTLGAADDQVYGFSGVLLSTGNGQDWTPGAEDVAPASLAVDPADADRVIATTEHGPTRSEDAGKTFTHLDGAPLLQFVAWPSPDALWGVGVDGRVHRSTDGGETWQARGTVDAPVAFTAGEDGAVAVTTETQVVVSRDGGESFEPVAEIAAGDHDH